MKQTAHDLVAVAVRLHDIRTELARAGYRQEATSLDFAINNLEIAAGRLAVADIKAAPVAG